jgi:hypothetical protein
MPDDARDGIFLPGQDHTLAGLIRPSLVPSDGDELRLTACVVSDPLVQKPGVTVYGCSAAELLAALAEARRWVAEARKAVPTLAPAPPPPPPPPPSAG